jgi:aspartate-semialdehyde dehydrogenase
MTARGAGLRVAVIGATGTLGSDLLSVLEARSFPLAELIPVATERSMGRTVEFYGQSIPVETDLSSLRGLGLVFLCVPASEALEWVRAALHAEVPCIDLSGAVEGAAEVPLLVANLCPDPVDLLQPVIATPAGPTLAWSLALEPIHRCVGLRRVVGTAFEAVSGAGCAGIESLQAEAIALFGQREVPEPTIFPHGIAFNCIPVVGEAGEGGETEAEEALLRGLHRLLGAELPVAVTAVRVPTFSGTGASIAVEVAEELSAAELSELLAKSPGVAVPGDGMPWPSIREAAESEMVLVGRVRSDPSCERGLLFWLAADPVRLAASNAVRLAESRFHVS